MRKSILIMGLYLLLFGLILPLLLNQLAAVTFRDDIPPWRTASYPIAVVGLLLVIIGLLVRTSSYIDASYIAKAYLYATLINMIAAVVFITPVLIPSLEFPILITRWPGIYMVTAYFSFIVVGILGSLGWFVIYSNFKRLFNRYIFDKESWIVQFALYQIGIYGLAFFMFWGGYTGSALSYEGAQDAMVGIVMEPTVIPSALFIYTLMFSIVLGVGNLISGTRELPKQNESLKVQTKVDLKETIL